MYCTVSVSRTQHENLKDCVKKLGSIIEWSLYKPPPVSADEKRKTAIAKLKANKRRIREKKERSAVKKGRNFWTNNNECKCDNEILGFDSIELL